VTILEPLSQVVLGGARQLPEPHRTADSSLPIHTFCQLVVQDGNPLIVADARRVPELRGVEAIATMGVVAYAGWPIIDQRGTVVGSLCAIDHQSREWTSAEVLMLRDLAACCSAELDVRADRFEKTLLNS
jgi:GAF domain-containing protein